jgi:hypothetical protein
MMISKEEICPNPPKILAIHNFLPPNVRNFFGNFFKKFS